MTFIEKDENQGDRIPVFIRHYGLEDRVMIVLVAADDPHIETGLPHHLGQESILFWVIWRVRTAPSLMLRTEGACLSAGEAHKTVGETVKVRSPIKIDMRTQRQSFFGI